MSENFNWSERDIECARTVLNEAALPPHDFLVLTDEEVVALDGLQHPQLVPTPWLDAQEITKEQLGGIALRGLLARGYIDPTFHDNGELELTANVSITGALVARRTARTILRCERVTNGGTGWLYGYIHEENVLIEDVDPNGLHGFSATTREGLLQRLLEATNPFEIEGRDGEALTFTEDEFAALTELPGPMAGAEAVSSVSSAHFDATDGANFVVYAGPERIAILTSEKGMKVAEVSAATLRARLEAATQRPLW